MYFVKQPTKQVGLTARGRSLGIENAAGEEWSANGESVFVSSVINKECPTSIS